MFEPDPAQTLLYRLHLWKVLESAYGTVSTMVGGQHLPSLPHIGCKVPCMFAPFLYPMHLCSRPSGQTSARDKTFDKIQFSAVPRLTISLPKSDENPIHL